MKKNVSRFLLVVLAVVVMLTIAACGNSQQATKTEPNAGGKKPVIALSNSFYGNTWRHQMVDAFEAAAKLAKAEGLIADYIILNGDGTQQTQMTQMNDLILKHVDIIAIDSFSPTAMNGAIEKAEKAGIKVLSFDSIATEKDNYKLNFDFPKFGKDMANYAVQQFNGKANVLIVRGVAGSAPDNDMYEGTMEVLKNHPDMKVVGTVYGQCTTSVTNSQISSILPSLPNVDVVILQSGGDDYGAVQAFQTAGKPVPKILANGSAEFVKWWSEENKKNGYTTWGECSTPGIGSAAVWLSIALANGENVPKDMIMPFAEISQKDLEKYQSMQPGTIVSPEYTKDWVYQNLLNKK
ncbi:MAG: sugar transporter substrate-binding protein [Firmicutes bacterium]|nr:sugar transporter substrate-binding protein [Bacillota bacterium]